jgi:hypothetical protein
VTKSGTPKRFVAESDAVCPVQRADVAYHLAADTYDATPHPTKRQELKLFKARAALRLACCVHVSGQTIGDK